MRINRIIQVAAMLVMLVSGLAHALNPNSDAAITYDASYFFGQYGNPSVVLTFSEMRDGTTYSNFNYGSHFFTGVTNYENSKPLYQVREDAFSSRYLIRSTNGYGGFWTATNWDGSTVRGGNMISIITPTGSEPFALTVISDSYSGFIGVIPDASNDSHFLIDLAGPWRIDEIQFGMQTRRPMASVSEPGSFAMLLAGLSLIGAITRRKKQSP